MNHVSKPDRGDYIRSIIYLTVYIIMISASAFWLLPTYWYIWALLVLGGMMLLVNWHKEQTAYQCPHCEHIYEISFLTDLITPHGVDGDGAWLYLRCPECQRRKKTRTLKKVK